MKCPVCGSEHCYTDRDLNICTMCGHEWSAVEESTEKVYKDCNGNVLVDGDSVSVIKDLKVKGSSLVVKQGTKVKSIRLVDEDHDISCKIDGIGAINLKTEFVKKL